MDIVLIAAVAENGVIGRDGEMPWHHPEDLRHFKETTTGHPVILGRKTYESIVADLGGPLPERTNVVLTTSDIDVPEENVVIARDVEDALAAAEETGTSTAYVAGGATVYEQFLPRADRMLLTEVPGTPEGDTYFPEWDDDRWREVRRDPGTDVTFVTYESVSPVASQ